MVCPYVGLFVFLLWLFFSFQKTQPLWWLQNLQVDLSRDRPSAVVSPPPPRSPSRREVWGSIWVTLPETNIFAPENGWLED